MKIKILLIAFLFLFLGEIMAQTKPKIKPPTQKEAEEKMEENQEESDDEPTDEEIQEMEKLGIKMPTIKDLPKMTAEQWQDAIDESERIVPKKDIARIASISKTPLTNSVMPVFLQSVHGQLISRLPPETKEDGEMVYQTIKSKYQTATAVGNSAVGCWLFGKTGIALYVMSRACKDDPMNDDNLNNFAALLTMSGAEQLALPILTRLNSQYPQNSTVLNNIAQAWFGLGDLDKANEYCDSTLILCPLHPHANMIKARIAESKGDKSEAIACIKKAIATAYSEEKENKLEKLGYELKSEDLNWDRPLIKDGLGLVGFKWPAYPKNVEESKLQKPLWEDFKDKCQAKINELQIQQTVLEQKWMVQQQKRTMEVLQASQTGTSASLFPNLAPKAYIKLAPLIKGGNNFAFTNEFEPVLVALKKVEGYEDAEAEAMKVLNEKYKNKFGEGKENPFTAHCMDENAIRNNFLNEANTTTEQRNRVYLNYASQQINNILYYRLHTQWPDEFALSKVIAESFWLTSISGQNVQFRNESESCRYKEKKDTTQLGKLSEFDEMHCKYKSEMNYLFGDINVHCGVITAKLDISFMKLGVKTKQGDRDKDNELFLDQFQTGYVEIGIRKGAGLGKGPLKVEAKAGIFGYLEVGKKGITDAGVKIIADLKVGSNILKPLDGAEGITIKDAAGKTLNTLDASMGPFKDLSVSIIGTETKISINSGFTVEGKFLGNKIKQ